RISWTSAGAFSKLATDRRRVAQGVDRRGITLVPRRGEFNRIADAARTSRVFALSISATQRRATSPPILRKFLRACALFWAATSRRFVTAVKHEAWNLN